jgi:hypothetical protein
MSEAKELTPEQKDLKMRHLTILGWIQSCTMQIQLDLCKEVLERCIANHFEPLIKSGKITLIEVGESYVTLKDEIFTQALRIVKNDKRQDDSVKGLVNSDK